MSNFLWIFFYQIQVIVYSFYIPLKLLYYKFTFFARMLNKQFILLVAYFFFNERNYFSFYSTIGANRNNSAVTVGPGAIGSWRCNTSNASSLIARIVRNAADGSGASGTIEPFAAVGRLLPSGVTNGSGGGPSHGPRTRASCPILRNSRAKPRTCTWTPPGIVKLYGEIRPMRNIFLRT